MPEKLYQAYAVTGSANTTVYDSGITSTETEKKRVLSVLINVSNYAGNLVQGWLEREKKVDVYDYVLNTDNATGTNAYRSTSKIIEIPLELDVPVGQTFKMAIKSGGTATNIQGAYKYEII